MDSWVGKICWRRDRLTSTVFLGFPCVSAGKEFAYNKGDSGLVPGLGRFPGEGKGYPLQYSGLGNSMDCIVYGVTKSRTRLSDFGFPFTVLLRFLVALDQLLLILQSSFSSVSSPSPCHPCHPCHPCLQGTEIIQGSLPPCSV